MQADDDRPAPLVDVMHPVAAGRNAPRGPANRDEVGRKRIQIPKWEGGYLPAVRWLSVDGRGSDHGSVTGRSRGYHSNPRNRVLSPLPNAVSSTFCPGWMFFSSAPIARAAGSAAETMLP